MAFIYTAATALRFDGISSGMQYIPPHQMTGLIVNVLKSGIRNMKIDISDFQAPSSLV
jgi:hypothetical protein